MPDTLKVLYVSAEVAPLVKTGGLGDVAFALPRALREQGHDVRVAMPCYGSIPRAHWGRSVGTCSADLNGRVRWGALRQSVVPGTEVPLYLIENHEYFMRENPYGGAYGEYPDNLERFCFFSMALLDAIAQTGWTPDIVHCNDWHTAVIPAYLKTRLAFHPIWGRKPSIFTIHNLRYQGRYPASLLPSTGLGWELFTPDFLEFYGDLNVMKVGIAFASKVSTVSRSYALEIQTPDFGHGLDGFLRARGDDLVGILNGVDYRVWNPSSDILIPAQYSADDLSGKSICKIALQRALGLPERDVPLFGKVSRLVWDKGVEQVAAALDEILEFDVQFVLLGAGEPGYETLMTEKAARYPDKMHTIIGYNESLSHHIYAGADFFVMPSLTEPCGLSQMYSLAYGTPPLVRKTGGLADTVVDATPANLYSGKATGIVFRPPTGQGVYHAMLRAMNIYQECEVLYQVRKTAMSQDYSWNRSSKEYLELYRAAIAKP